jgi:hypothetical protein
MSSSRGPVPSGPSISRHLTSSRRTKVVKSAIWRPACSTALPTLCQLLNPGSSYDIITIIVIMIMIIIIITIIITIIRTMRTTTIIIVRRRR